MSEKKSGENDFASLIQWAIVATVVTIGTYYVALAMGADQPQAAAVVAELRLKFSWAFMACAVEGAAIYGALTIGGWIGAAVALAGCVALVFIGVLGKIGAWGGCVF